MWEGMAQTRDSCGALLLHPNGLPKTAFNLFLRFHLQHGWAHPTIPDAKFNLVPQEPAMAIVVSLVHDQPTGNDMEKGG
jgi:hypothetical protein